MKSLMPQPAIKRAIFLGSKRLGLGVLEGLLKITPNVKWTIIHPNDEQDARSVLSSFIQLARDHDADFLVCPSASAARLMIDGIKPDIGFVCGWYWLLGAPILDMIRGGLWGIHNSLLPKYRGGAPLVWSIINGDGVVGSTVFRISVGMDDGAVLHQVRVALQPEHTIADALDLIEQRLLEELPAKWVDLMRGAAVVEAQREADATYCGQRTEEDGAIDWHANARRVHDFIRAQSLPYPGAFSYWQSIKVAILGSKIFPGTYFGTPGQILRRNDRSVLVSCGEDTALEVLNIVVKGKEQVPSALLTTVRARFSEAMPEVGNQPPDLRADHSSISER